MLPIVLAVVAQQPGNASPHYYFPPERPIVKRTIEVEACVYGATASGVITAVQLRKLGRTVALLANGDHLGGLTTGGLSYTDIGNKAAIGGMARDFYRRVGKAYGVAEEWTFEPHVAEQVLDEMATESGVPIYKRQFLKSVQKDHARITSLTTEAGLTVDARVFIDASYEGDLMAKAGVQYRVGRESNAEYSERLNGVEVRNLHQFQAPVDPNVREGDPESGLLPGISAGPLAPQGTGDKRLQAYCFRLCLTRAPENRIPFPKPPGYDRSQYELLARYLRHPEVRAEIRGKFDPLRGQKVDKNNHGAVSTDYIGMNYGYPNGDYRRRERIFQEHVRYQQGLFWFLCNDPEVPAEVRDWMSQWGLCRDEFADAGGWPSQLYIREARRMVSDYVMTEHDCRGDRRAEDGVGLGAYNMDSHNCQRFVTADGRVMNEGDVQEGGIKPYPISYRSIVPMRGQCANLFVPVCLSATHIAYGSIRMEPVFMILGQSAALAADLALQRSCPVQEVPYADLRPRLEAAGQVLTWPAARQ